MLLPVVEKFIDLPERKLVDLSKYKDWAGYEQMSQLNIEGVYRLVQATRRPNQ
jgi:hypothetical protein